MDVNKGALGTFALVRAESARGYQEKKCDCPPPKPSLCLAPERQVKTDKKQKW